MGVKKQKTVHVYIMVHWLVKKYYIPRRRSVKGSLSCFISLVSFLTPSRDEKILRRRLFPPLFSAVGLTYFFVGNDKVLHSPVDCDEDHVHEGGRHVAVEEEREQPDAETRYAKHEKTAITRENFENIYPF